MLMIKTLAEMTDAELEAERFDADVDRYVADYIDSFREWRRATDSADDRLNAVTDEITRRELARLENMNGRP